MNKYTKQRTNLMNGPINKEVWSPLKQVYVPKEVSAAPMKAIKQSSLAISSMEVPVNGIDELLVIENTIQSSMEKVEIGVAANDDETESTKPNSKYFQQK